MYPPRWRRVEEIYQAAVEQKPEERAAFQPGARELPSIRSRLVAERGDDLCGLVHDPQGETGRNRCAARKLTQDCRVSRRAELLYTKHL